MAGEADRQRGSGFSDLSDDLLAQISSGSHGFPLLALSRRGRDAVLDRASTIQLNLMQGQGDLAPVARLLDRACRAAKHGMHLQIKNGYIADHVQSRYFWNPLSSTILPTLLQQGLDTGGWVNVHALSLVVRESMSPVLLVSLTKVRTGI